MNWAASCLVNRCSKELYKMEGFYRQEDGTKKLLAKEKKGLFKVGHLSLGKG